MPRTGLTGDFAKLKLIQKKIETTPALVKVINANLADEAISLIKEGIDAGIDPYGKPYKRPLALRSGHPLKDTGGLKASWFRKLSSTGFRVESAKDYTIYHQLGTGIHGPKRKRIVAKNGKALKIPMRGGKPMFRKSVAGTPQRKMIPDRGLPAKWRRAFVDTSTEILVDHFSK